ncbi:MAG: hypothetical protein J7L43_02315 [Candidatus Aenigmarchaeota archaeon]|nr:hypothetical protein [Candidatus Aenigmarchaeota archaeon]
MNMLLVEAQKKLLELKIKFNDNGIKIEDIQTIDHKNYGYVVAMVNTQDDIHEEVIKTKLTEINGKQVMPDLWVFGPFIKEEKK